MKLSLVVLGCFAPLASFAQVLWGDNFDSYAQGGLNGQGGWVTTNPPINVVAGGNGRPEAHTPGQMVLQQPASGAAFALHLPDGWSGRNAGNDVLVLTGAIYVSAGTSNLGSAIMQVVGFNGGSSRMGYVGLINNQFIYGTGDSILFGSSATMGQWNEIRIEVDTVANVSKMYGNGTLLGTESFLAGLTLNNWGFQTTSLGGAVSNPVFFDTMQVEAVPEPFSLVGFGLAGLIVARRKRG